MDNVRFFFVVQVAIWAAGLHHQAHAQTWYEQHTVAAFSSVNLTYQCLAEKPDNNVRTTIGIGEEVEIALSGAWGDYDLKYPEEIVVSDAAKVTWTLTQDVGGGAKLTTLTGWTTVLSAGRGSSNTQVTVSYLVTDSRTKFNDTQFFGGSVTFDVIVPAGTATVFAGNDPEKVGDLGPPDEQFGAWSYFVNTITPTTVSFYGIKFRENRLAHNLVFPSGAQDPEPQYYAHFGIWYTDPNTWQDISGAYARPVSWIYTSGQYVDHNWDLTVEYEYETDIRGEWHHWGDALHMREVRASDRKCSVGLDVDGPVVWGGWQGPFKY